jgi:predicted transcriptional regulator of viral defense system
MRGQAAVRTGDLRKALSLSPLQERNLLSRLARAGWIARVRRGLYLVPRTLPLGGKWSPDEALALNTLLADAKGRYQISGPNAFNRYGFDEQVPARVYAYNNRISGERSVGAVRLVLIKVADERLGGTEEATTRDGLVTVYASRARTLLDAVYDWARFDSLPRGYRWIRGELEKNRVSAAELVDMTLRYGDVGTLRRIGLLLEQAGIDGRLLRKLERKVPKSTGFIPWIPTSPKRGSINRRWGVVVNGAA